MTTAPWALLISLASLLIASASLIWNVWQKLIFPKPRVGVSFMVMFIVGSEPPRRLLTLNFTNFGPGDVVIDCAVARPKTPWHKRRTSFGMLNPIANLAQPDNPTGPYAGGLPKKMAIGEEHMLYFPYQANLFMSDDVTPVFHPATTRDRPLLSRRSADEATVGFKPDRCFSSSAAKAAGVA